MGLSEGTRTRDPAAAAAPSPVPPEPDVTEPVGPAAIDPEPVAPEPLALEPVGPEPVGPDPVGIEPLVPPSVDPALAEPVAEVPVEPATPVAVVGPVAATELALSRAVPPGLQVAAAWSWRVLLVVVVVIVLGWLARYLSQVVVPVAIAVLLAALLSPVANRLRSWGLPRGAATAITVLGGLALILGALTLIGTQIAEQASTLSGNVVQSFYTLLDYLRNGPLPIPDVWLNSSEWSGRISDVLRDSQSVIAEYAAAIGTGAGHFLAGFAIALFALFYFLYDGRGIFTFLLHFIPRPARARVDEAARKGWRSLSSYMRATILVALVDAVGVLVVALILGVPVAPALAALVFIGAFIPLVGAVVSGFVAVAVALVALGWVQALIMLAGLIVVMQVEGHVLQPFLLGRAVKLHPLAVLLAIAIGIIAGGIVGALLAVPLLAFVKSFVQYLAGAAEPVPARLRWPTGPRWIGSYVRAR